MYLFFTVLMLIILTLSVVWFKQMQTFSYEESIFDAHIEITNETG